MQAFSIYIFDKETDELRAITVGLKFDKRWDMTNKFRTKSVLVAPLDFKGHHLGVMQLINKLDDETFTNFDRSACQKFARTLALAMFNVQRLAQTRSMPGKYDYLCKHFWVPIILENGETAVLATDPTEIDRMDSVTAVMRGNRYTLLISSHEDILRFIDHRELGGASQQPGRVATGAPSSQSARKASGKSAVGAKVSQTQSGRQVDAHETSLQQIMAAAMK